MYEEFFHFSTHPFRNSPDPSFFYRSANHRDALAMLCYGIREGKGFMLVTGDVGTGKTMLVQALKAELADRVVLVEVAYPWVSAEDILSTLRARIGLPVVAPESPSAVEGLRERLEVLAAEGRDVVVVIDEAHQLPVKTLEGIRLISNIESTTRKLLQIVLLGQEELGTLLSQYSLRQVQQRIALSCHLSPLNSAETAEYIRHRLRVANGNPELFSPGAAEQVYQYSGGCPRLINQACDYCLLFAFGKFAPAVHDSLAREALGNMTVTQTLPAMKRGIVAEQPAVSNPSAASAAPALNSVPAAAADAPPPPFLVPGTPRRWAAEPDQPNSRNPILLLVGGGMLLAAVALGGAALWLVLNRGAESGLGSGKGASRQSVDAQVAKREAPQTSAESAKLIGLGLPLGPASVGSKTVETSRDLSLALLASQHFGAWNATIRDILAAANPQLGSFETLPPGTRVVMPAPTRAGMMVSDAAGRQFIYFGSFDSEEIALREIEPLQRVWSSVRMVVAERAGVKIFRVYVGPFASPAEAGNVAAALWFKFIPALGLEPATRGS
ncbi:hypothetical protein BURK2_04087 [Burkholderiales bacterium]|nr:hypothetical protein BURK2_04087 [Burkholderiales bacterium]